MPNKLSISACFPAFNEGKTVYSVVKDAYSTISNLCDNFEIIVCNDGSTDNTLQELQRLSAEFPKIRLLDNGTNRGLAYTFARLYSEARMEFVFLNATDGQWPNQILVDMIPLAVNNDIVVSVRMDKHYGWFRSGISYIYRLLPIIAFGTNLRDAGGVKLISKQFLYTDSLYSKSPFADAERLIRASRDGARVAYVPVNIRPRKEGKSNAIALGVLVRCVWDFLRLCFILRFNKCSAPQSRPSRSP